MPYDPRRDRPQPASQDDQLSAVDALLEDAAVAPAPDADGPPDTAAGAPTAEAASAPTTRWSDRLLHSVGLSSILAAATALAVLRFIWKCRQRRRRSGRRGPGR